MLFKIPRQKMNYPKNLARIILSNFMKGGLMKGSAIKRFEDKFAKYTGTKHAIAVYSGRIALYLIIKSLKLKPNDEVILPAYTYHIIPSIIISCNLKPIFVDIDEETLNIDTSLIKNKITKKTKVIIPTHLFGQPCEIEKILLLAKKHGLFVIEDCAQACGAGYKRKKVGSIGDAGFFSFEVSKNINTLGGGMITTNSDKLAESIRKEIDKNYGWPSASHILRKILSFYYDSLLISKIFFSFVLYPTIRILDLSGRDILEYQKTRERNLILRKKMLGCKYKFTNLQANLGISQLESLHSLHNTNKKRIRISGLYSSLLKNMKNIKTQKSLPNTKPTHLFYTILSNKRGSIARYLLHLGIDTRKNYMDVCSNLDIYKRFSSFCPNAEKISREVLHLPIDISRKDCFFICKKIREILDFPYRP